MINIDNLEKFIMDALADGEKFSVRKEGWIEILTRLRQAEKDAARYRWLKEVARHDYDIDDFFDGSCDRIDSKVDECIEAMQCK